jgi:hypothetical protein
MASSRFRDQVSVGEARSSGSPLQEKSLFPFLDDLVFLIEHSHLENDYPLIWPFGLSFFKDLLLHMNGVTDPDRPAEAPVEPQKGQGSRPAPARVEATPAKPVG